MLLVDSFLSFNKTFTSKYHGISQIYFGFKQVNCSSVTDFSFMYYYNLYSSGKKKSPYLITILLLKWIAKWLIGLQDKAIWEDKMGVEMHLEM